LQLGPVHISSLTLSLVLAKLTLYSFGVGLVFLPLLILELPWRWRRWGIELSISAAKVLPGICVFTFVVAKSR
jgi:hypothetical protein